MNSPHGRRGAILAHFGWRMDYLLNGIAWSIVQRMMIDAPSFDIDNNNETVELTEENTDDIMNYVNNMM